VRGASGRKYIGVLSASVLVMLAAGRAGATDATNADRVLALELFKEGRALLAEKHYPEACRKLEESERLDAGGGTLLNLALCHELEGRTATAWSEFHEALAIARRDGRADREEQAQRHIEALEPRLARLVIAVPPEARLPELVVRRDGNTIGAAAWGAAVPVDPGPHLVNAEAVGRVGWQTSIEASGEGTQKTVYIPALEPSPPPPPPSAVPVPPAPEATTFSSLPPSASGHPAWQRPVAVAVVWLGVASAAFGITFGLQARTEWSEARPHCANGCDDGGYRSWSQAKDHATLSTIALAIGGAALTGGIALWLTAPSSRPTVRMGATADRIRLTIGAEF
jgi:hypothetical protein